MRALNLAVIFLAIGCAGSSDNESAKSKSLTSEDFASLEKLGAYLSDAMEKVHAASAGTRGDQAAFALPKIKKRCIGKRLAASLKVEKVSEGKVVVERGHNYEPRGLYAVSLFFLLTQPSSADRGGPLDIIIGTDIDKEVATQLKPGDKILVTGLIKNVTFKKSKSQGGPLVEFLIALESVRRE